MTPSLRYWNGSAFVSPTFKFSTSLQSPKFAYIWDGTKFVRVWPDSAPFRISITTAGTFTSNLPDWWRVADLVLIGAGGGGGGGGSDTSGGGFGGNAGIWATRTITRGDDVPWNTLSLAGIVGTGGNGGSGGFGPNAGGTGGSTSCTTAPLTAAGGTGGSNANYSGSGGLNQGRAPGDKTYNGQLYVGGVPVGGFGSVGSPPGAGGNGGQARFGLGGLAGGKGGDGAAFIYVQ
ncbi:minor tail protein [Mycobacterium phage Jeffabunny]|uniref:Glycine-rich domain-containing protein n=5 Tax=Gladiatorvirus TaxID=2948726 RepID=V5R4D0_9CAUD|nr:minor tail protein [Mycobacterium phage CloudWang3]YP_008858435.1 minor tail protein [Mycobacterium phage Artemis2UCLA]YP_008859118.1 minor tail protein [Mycobacterium phage Zaka]YP_009224133.1 minor tail protein [Mycobacterium phage VohminGhazi]YP_009638182.1 minor tail protein [Mycobacterium phage Jeffabunny]YP_010061333.1 minor tail protein [Mycobacterium phage Koko]AEK08454.1 hypothetical protein PBI_DAVINCI_8 [Mycobacterium phage DaVinci]AMQ66845.1 hypothetical protein PBI_MCFLY_8 [M